MAGKPCGVALSGPDLIARWYAATQDDTLSDEERYRRAEQRLRARHLNFTDRSQTLGAFKGGRTYLAMGKPDEALVWFDADLNIFPQLGYSLAGRGHVLTIKKRYREAILEFDKAIDFWKPDAEKSLAEMAPYLAPKVTRDQLSTFRSDPRFWMSFMPFEGLIDVYEARGYAYEQLGEAEAALADYDRVLAIMPRHRFVSFLRRRLEARACRGGEAGQASFACGRMRPPARAGVANPYENLARRMPWLSRKYRSQKRKSPIPVNFTRYRLTGLYDIILDYALSREVTPEERYFPDVLFAEYLAAKGDYQAAHAAYEADRRQRREAEVTGSSLIDRARVLIAVERYDDAMADLNSAANSEFDDAEARYVRGLLHATMGDFKAAAADFEFAMTDTFDNGVLAHLGLARSRAMLGDTAGALEVIGKALELVPKLARAHELRALVYLIVAEGDDTAAQMAALEHCVSTKP